MPGAGQFPAGLYPAGLGPPNPATSSGWARPWRALFLDPAKGQYGVRSGTQILQELDPIDAKFAFIGATPRGSLAISPNTGNTFKARLANVADDQRLPMAKLSVNESFADMIAAGDIAILGVAVDFPIPGAFFVAYDNLRADQVDAPTRPT